MCVDYHQTHIVASSMLQAHYCSIKLSHFVTPFQSQEKTCVKLLGDTEFACWAWVCVYQSGCGVVSFVQALWLRIHKQLGLGLIA